MNDFWGSHSLSFRQDSSDDVVYEHIVEERMYALDTTKRKGIIVLPSQPKIGFRALVSDRHNTWLYNPLIVHRNGNKLAGLEENMICDEPQSMFVCEFKNKKDGWIVHQNFKLSDFR